MLVKRERYYEAAALTLGATDQFDLPDTGFLSFIKLDFRATNGNDIFTVNRNRIVDHLTEIKISDGGTRTLFTLRGQEIKALLRAQQGSILPETANFLAGASQLTTLIIPFGRFLRDPEFILDLDPWRQLVLEITNDGSATEFVVESLNVDIQLVWIIDPPAKPKEFMKYFTWREDKPARDGQHVYHELPFDDPIFMCFAQLDPDLEDTGCATNDPISDSYNVKFTLDERMFPLWDHRPKDIARTNAAIYGTVQTHLRTPPSDSQFFDLALAYVHALADADIDAVAGAFTENWHDSNDRFQITRLGFTPCDMKQILVDGVGYYHTLFMLHMIDSPRAAWLDPKHKMDGGRGPVRIDVTGYRDDFTLRTCIGTPMIQGRT